MREGVEHGGNKSGIPTVNGSIVFDERFVGKPLVYCGTGGIMPRMILGEPSHEKTGPAGGLDRHDRRADRERRDSRSHLLLRGASRRIPDQRRPDRRPHHPETDDRFPSASPRLGSIRRHYGQRRRRAFLLGGRDGPGLQRLRDESGAGPLEVCRPGPLGDSSFRSPGAHDPGRSSRRISTASWKWPGRWKWRPPSWENFTDSGKFHILYEGKTVAYLDMDFLHDGYPQMELRAKWEKKKYPEPAFPEPPDLTAVLLKILSRYNVCSKESVIRQYDHEVQAGTVVKPMVGAFNDGPGDATVFRPLLDAWEGVVISSGICPRYSDLDAYHMMACAIDEAIRNNIAVGGNLKHMAGLDNFCWCDPVQSEKTPDGEYKLAQLVRANQALYDYTTAFGVPCISGKDSMKNDYLIGSTKISIPPTVLFSAVSVVKDVRRCVTMDAKKARRPGLCPGGNTAGDGGFRVFRPPRLYRQRGPQGGCQAGQDPL